MKYENPPVVETVLSVQFNPLRNFGAAQLGAYWKELGPDWPHVTEVPAVEPVFEQFESAKAWGPASFGLKFSQKIDLRLQIRNRENKDRMIQVQNGRFFYNWLGTPGTEYPSYHSVRPEFDEQWEKFREFVLSRSDEGVVQPNQWEIIYVNHMPRGTVWEELSDLPQTLTLLREPDLKDLNLGPKGISGEWQFEVLPRKGMLYVKLGMSKQENGTPCVVMTLRARGPVSEGTSSLDDGLKIGHTAITGAFDRLTSTKAQEFWGVQHGNG